MKKTLLLSMAAVSLAALISQFGAASDAEPRSLAQAAEINFTSLNRVARSAMERLQQKQLAAIAERDAQRSIP